MRFKCHWAFVPLLVLLLLAAGSPSFASTAIITTGPCPTAAVGGSSICTDAVVTASGGQIQFSLGLSSPWSVTGANPTNFSVVGDTSRGACSLGLVVPSGQSCYLLVYFFPSAAGTRTATIAPVLAIGTATSAALSGVGQNPGVAVVGVPSCATTTVGSSTSCGTATLTASGGPIEVTYTTPVYSLAGTNPGDFTLGTPSSNACYAFEQLASGATCNLATVSFAPGATGSRSATLAASTYLYGTAGSGTLSGTGINPQCTFTFSSSTSCSTAYGSPATCGSLTLSASSSACSSSLTSIAIAPSGNFSQTNNCPATMSQGQSCTVTPTYQANTTSAVTGTVTVTTSNNNPTGTVSATPTFGTATVSAGGVTCPAAGVGTSVACTGNLTVTATAAPIIFGPTLQGTSGNTADFVLSAPTSAACAANQTLSTGASCNLASVTFSPTAAGSRSETITVTPAGGSAGSATLSATGSYGAATVSVGSVTCSGTVGIATPCTGSAKITATNGPVVLNATPGVVSGANAADFAMAGGACASASLTVNQSCTLGTLTFTAGGSGTRAAVLSSSVANGTTTAASLSGTGVAAGSASVSSVSCGSAGIGASIACSGTVTVLATGGDIVLGTTPYSVSGATTEFTYAAASSSACVANQILRNGSSCNLIQLSAFAPTAAGAQSLSITVNTADGAAGSGVVSGTGVYGAAVVSTSGVTCPAAGVGTSAACTGTVTVTASSAPIVFGTTVSTTSGNTADFILGVPTSSACAANQTLNAGSSCNVASVTFTPTAAGARSETITVSPASGSAGSAVLSATGTFGAATVSVSGVTCSGTVGIAAVCTASAKITATNGPVVLSATPAAFSGTNATDFSLAAGGCASANLTVNQTCTLGTISFTAGGSGTRTAVLTSSVVNGTATAASLSGTGAAAGFASVSSVSCGSAGIGVSTPCAGTLSVTAAGGDIMLGGPLYSVTGATAEFTYVGPSSGACAANQILRNGTSCNLLQLSAFAPTAAGTRSLAVTVNASDGTAGSGVVSGTGVYGAAVVGAAGVSCPGTGIGLQAACSGSVTVTATGGAIVFSTTLEVPTGNVSDFTLGTPTVAACSPNQTLANGASCNLVSVSFNPTAAGTRTETLTVTPANGTSGSSALSGTGLYGTVALSTSSLNCGSVGAGLTAGCGTFTLTAQNGAVTLASTPFVNSDSTDFTVPAGTCTGSRTLTTNQTCTTGSITFAPHSVASQSATVTVETAGGGGPSVTLTGIGTAGVASVAPISLACPATTVGTPVSCGAVSVTAEGGPLTLASPALSFAGNPNYTVSAGTCIASQTLTVGQTCTTGAIVFDPSSAGTMAATLTVSCGSGCSATVALTGTGYTYSWQAGGWTPVAGSNCTASLTQTRTVTCLRSDGAPVNAVNCDQATEPASSQIVADFGGCTYDWQVGPWSACSGGTAKWQYTSWLPSSGCGVTDQTRAASCVPDASSATQSRSVLCVRADGTTVANASCSGTSQPASAESCTPTTGYSCGPTAPTEQSVLLTDLCSYAWIAGPWSAWSSSCSVDATRSRSVQCQRSDGTIMDNASCDPETMPASADSAGNFIGCTYAWFAGGFGACGGGTSSWLTGAWQPTSGCGPVLQTRTLTCVADVNSGTETQTVACQRSDGAIVADSSCEGATKPAVGLNCTPSSPSCGAAPASSQTITLASTCPSGCTPNPANDRYCVMTPL